MHRWFTLVLVALTLSIPTTARTDGPTVVTLTAPDSQTLGATYYAPPAPNAPAVLLLHQLYTTGESWDGLSVILQSAGYAVLAPDLRGYGVSRGALDWRAAQDDTLLWLDWLREQPGVRGDRIALMGSSMGANLAVIGCAGDVDVHGPSGCVTAVALSPGRNYFGMTPLAPALDGGLATRPVLFVTGDRDEYPALAARELAPDYPNVTVQWVPGNAHGVDLLDAKVINLVMEWLSTH